MWQHLVVIAAVYVCVFSRLNTKVRCDFPRLTFATMSFSLKGSHSEKSGAEMSFLSNPIFFSSRSIADNTFHSVSHLKQASHKMMPFNGPL